MIFKQINRNVWIVSLASLLINTSGVILFCLSPFYLTSCLMLNHQNVGQIEAWLDMLAWFSRFFFGVLSDAMRKRKGLLMAAYSCTALSRLLLTVLTGATGFLLSKTIDRLGNGLQAPSREALVGDFTSKKLQGTSYGLRQSCGMLGSAIGAVLIFWLMKKMNYNEIFIISAIPAILALICTAIFIKDKTTKTKAKQFKLSNITTLPKQYWRLLVVIAVFMFSQYNGAFQLLQARSAGLAEEYTGMLMIIQNLMAFLCAYPVGRIADRVDRRYLLAICYLTVILSNFCQILATQYHLGFTLLAIALWGVNIGCIYSLFSAQIAATTAQAHMLGTAFGIYYFICGVMAWCANQIAGWISHNLNPDYLFIHSSLVALLAVACMLFLGKGKQQ